MIVVPTETLLLNMTHLHQLVGDATVRSGRCSPLTGRC